MASSFRTKNSFLAIVYVITYHMNSFKWILYWFAFDRETSFYCLALGIKRSERRSSL